MSRVLAVLAVLAVVMGVLTGRMAQVSQATVTGAGEAVQLMLRIGGTLCLWNGLMEVMQRSGLALLRPFSGSGALSVGSSVMEAAGPDSTAGRVAAVMLGSSDTSFYTIAVYSAALGLKDTRYTLKAALCADLTAFLMSGLAVSLLMG